MTRSRRGSGEPLLRDAERGTALLHASESLINAHKALPDEEQEPDQPLLTRPFWVALFFGLVLLAGAFTAHQFIEEPDYAADDDKCFASNEIQLMGLPVDACLTREAVDTGTDCGEPAANEWCKMQGTNYFVNYTLSDAPIKDKLGAITLGNKFLGGKLGFEKICCDVGIYQPSASRWLLLAAGALLLWVVAQLAARASLSFLELAVVKVFDAGESLYFLLGVEQPVRLLLYSWWLTLWVSFTLWEVWCGNGIDCESHGSRVRATIYNSAQCLLLFSGAYLFSRAAPRIICVRYLWHGQFAQVRDLMRKEVILGALVSEDVRRTACAAVTARAGSSSPTAAGEAGGGGSSTAGAKFSRESVEEAAARSMQAVSQRIAELQLGSGSAISRLDSFLRKYQCISEAQLLAEAQAEGQLLFETLRLYDVNADGAVGIHDFEQIFNQSPVAGFTPAEAANMAWRMFDLNTDGRLSASEVVAALEGMYLARANAARTLLSNESAVRSLETAIGFVLYTLLLFACVNILGITRSFGGSTGGTLDFFTTYVLALSFIFGDTVKSIFRSAVYLFNEQPYAVGDYLELDGDLWRVERFNLLYTTLCKWEENQICKIPNDTLIDSQLVNVSRGGSFKDSIEFYVPLSMPMSSIHTLKALLVDAAASRPKEFILSDSSPHVKISAVESNLDMELAAEWVYAFPPGDRARMDDDRDFMISSLKEAIVKGGMDTVTSAFGPPKRGRKPKKA